MKTIRRLLLVLLGVAIAIIFWQNKKIDGLQKDLLGIRNFSSELDHLRAENARLSGAERDSDEITRRRKEHSELLRLRGEVSRLREQLKSQPSVAEQSGKEEAPAVESRFEIFSANFEADVAPGHTLIAGGWDTADGKKTFLFVEPRIIDENGNEIASEQAQTKSGTAQIDFQTKFVELSKESLQALGLNNLLSGKNDSEHFIMNGDQYRLLIENMGDTDGTDILAVPRVTTLNGRQTQVAVLEEITIDNQKYPIGPVVDLIPHISADGRFVRTILRATITRDNRRNQ